MKKNLKQIIYSERKVASARQRTLVQFFLALMVILAIPMLCGAIVSPESMDGCLTVLGTQSLASMMAIGSIDDVSDAQVSGSQLGYKIWLVEMSQVDDSVPFPAANASREQSTIPLKSGELAHYFEAHDIPEFTSKGERGDLTVSATSTLTMIMGGNRDVLLNFIEQHTGGKFIVFFQKCGESVKYVMGDPCKPMILKGYDAKINKESNSTAFTFERNSIRQYYKYVGDLQVAAPVSVAADLTTLPIQAGVNQYVIPNGTSSAATITAVSGITASDKGRAITLVGGGSTHPSVIAENSVFILEDGASWTARTGSRITFRILDATTLVEVQGSRIQTA